jgi:polyhydroxybutyrate depolymerase
MNRFRKLLNLLPCLVLIATLQASEQDGNAKTWKSGQHTVKIDGQERSFIIDIPKQLKPGAALVMVFHGYTGSAQEIRKDSQFTTVAEKQGFVAVYPDGTRDKKGNRFFNVGYAFHKKIKVDDVKFARELATRLVQDLDLDPRSVFSTGFSNGGDMSYFLACQPETFVTAIAPLSGCMMSSWADGFAPAARISVMAVHGTRDKITLWAGDPKNRDGWGAYLGTEPVMNVCVKGLSLEKSEVTELAKLQSRKKKLTLRLHRWSTTVDNAEVRLYEIQGGGHTWPGNLGKKELSTAAEIWAFFQHHRP